MNNNSNITCICNIGFNEGALKKVIENNIFTIFGNVSKNNTIVLRYHGELIDNICYEHYNNNLYIRYFFDDDVTNTIDLPLAKCTKSIGENYCCIIELGQHEKITFFFANDKDLRKEDIELMNFNLKINDNLLDTFIEKYDNYSSNLPVLENNKGITLKGIINRIKAYLVKFCETVKSPSN